MSSIARYRETLRRWGVTDVPFRAAPPEDPAELSRVSLEGDLLVPQEDGQLLPSMLLPDEEEHSD